MTTEPPDGVGAASPRRAAPDSLSPMTVHELVGGLTAIKGIAQLLRRRLDRGQTPDPDHLRRWLGGIDAVATDLAARLHGLRRDDR